MHMLRGSLGTHVSRSVCLFVCLVLLSREIYHQMSVSVSVCLDLACRYISSVSGRIDLICLGLAARLPRLKQAGRKEGNKEEEAQSTLTDRSGLSVWLSVFC